MKIIVILILFSSAILYSQTEQSKCKRMRDSLEALYSSEYDSQPMPTVIGSMDSLVQNLKYPPEAKKNKIEGKVLVQVIIDTTGIPMCPKVISKKLGFNCEAEAIKFVMGLRYTPVTVLHKKYFAEIVVPVLFSLKHRAK